MKKILNAWCILYGWYVSVGDWMVKQVDSNDYLAGFWEPWPCIPFITWAI